MTLPKRGYIFHVLRGISLISVDFRGVTMLSDKESRQKVALHFGDVGTRSARVAPMVSCKTMWQSGNKAWTKKASVARLLKTGTMVKKHSVGTSFTPCTAKRQENFFDSFHIFDKQSHLTFKQLLHTQYMHFVHVGNFNNEWPFQFINSCRSPLPITFDWADVLWKVSPKYNACINGIVRQEKYR